MSKQRTYPKVGAHQIEALLRKRHSEDFFVSQAKNGPTQYGKGLLILDAWAMKKSWANPLTIGYEIKVSRQDFLKDDKWHGYLDYCNEFYFAVPPGIIDPAELPPAAGLLVASTNTTVLLTRKKAQRRQVEIEPAFYKYMLMSKVNDEDEPGQESYKQRFWKKWLEHKEFDYEFGHSVSRTLAKRVREEIISVRDENTKLRARMETLEQIEAFCRRNDINIDHWDWKRQVQKRLDGIDPSFLSDLESLQISMSRITKYMKEKDVKEEAALA
jgi:hypothetical protein